MAPEIYCRDGIAYCQQHPESAAVVTSLPDPEEIIFPEDSAYDGDPWAFFTDAVKACATATHPQAPLVFRQTDRRSNGTISKAQLIFKALEDTPLRLLWHKIVLHQDPETTDIHRPTYAHLLGFAREGVGPGSRTPDVLRPGDTLYANGMGLATAERMVQFAGPATGTVLDPFCGRGTVPAMAHALGYHGIGVDLDPEQAEYARNLRLSRP